MFVITRAAACDDVAQCSCFKHAVLLSCRIHQEQHSWLLEQLEERVLYLFVPVQWENVSLWRLWSKPLFMVAWNLRHTWHSAQSQFLPWLWGMLAGWQQPGSLRINLMKNVVIVVTVRSFSSVTTDSCCVEAKGYDTFPLQESSLIAFVHWKIPPGTSLQHLNT